MQSHSIDLPIATDHHPSCLWATASQTQLSACSKNYKLRAVYVWVSSTSGCSGVAQGLLYRHGHVDVKLNLVRKKHWTRWQQGTTSHGDVEDMELSDTVSNNKLRSGILHEGQALVDFCTLHSFNPMLPQHSRVLGNINWGDKHYMHR